MHYFNKTPVPTEMQEMPPFIHILAKCGVTLAAYTAALEAQDEERYHTNFITSECWSINKKNVEANTVQ